MIFIQWPTKTQQNLKKCSCTGAVVSNALEHLEFLRNLPLPEFILRVPTTGAKQIDFYYIVKQRKSKMLFHFFLIFSFLFSVIASIYVAFNTTEANCLNNCTATFTEGYTCFDLFGDGICESLSNPRQNVTNNEKTLLQNIPCILAVTVSNGCP